jgi:hypothetical protein
MKQRSLLSRKRFHSYQFFEIIFYRKNLEGTSVVNKRSSSQKNVNLSPTQRLDNLIQSSTHDLTFEGIQLEKKTSLN